ncbi:hypothetical protein [Listeria rocourtiae]|uniref:hypothetical protein n=1 Tax=Listeria rocourtiae TaxID=647910 RepID=UPI003D2F5E65
MFFHLVKRKALIFDRYMRVYLESGRLYFFQVGGDFYNRKAFEESMAGNIIAIWLFQLPYYLATKKQKKRELECDQLVHKKAFLSFLHKSSNFKIEIREISKVELKAKNIFGQAFTNYSKFVLIEVNAGKVYRLDIPFGEDVDKLICRIESAGIKIENKILE